jgi:hypothetical protein
MGSVSDANSAISGLNEFEHEGRRLNVGEAKPREAHATSLPRGRGVVPPGPYGGNRRYRESNG